MSEVFRRRSEHIPNTNTFLVKTLWFWESIVINSVYMEFLFLTLVWVHIFLKSVPFMVVITHIFWLGMRNWFVSVSWHEIEVFNSQAWRESWQVYRNHNIYLNHVLIVVNCSHYLHWNLINKIISTETYTWDIHYYLSTFSSFWLLLYEKHGQAVIANLLVRILLFSLPMN